MKRFPPYLPLIAMLIALLAITACASRVVQKGDYVLVTYTGMYQNGTVFDTNDIKERSLFPDYPDSHFALLPVQVGSGQVVPGFENALLGMKKGETKNVKIKAKDAYGGYDPSKTVKVPKNLTFPREMTLNRTAVTQKAAFLQNFQVTSVQPGQVFDTTDFTYNVTAVNSTDVTLYRLNATGDPIRLESFTWNSTLVKSTQLQFTYRNNVEPGRLYDTAYAYGPYNASLNSTHILLDTVFRVGQEFNTPSGPARVTTESLNAVTIDFNAPLAGEDLNFTITINTIQQKK